MNQLLIDQGVELMTYGMGTVFVFLTLLVCATTLMSTLLGKFSASETVSPKQPVKNKDEIDSHVIAAITAAIKLHRSRK